jgi:hypothetical protein
MQRKRDSLAARVRRGWRLAPVLAIVGAGVLVPAAPARAGSTCTNPLCSESFNRTAIQVTALRDWCTSTDVIYQHEPPDCDPNDGQGPRTMTLWQNQHTPEHEDWDGIRVDYGWRYTVQIYSIFTGWEAPKVLNPNFGPSTWVRIHDWQTMYIIDQTAAGQPVPPPPGSHPYGTYEVDTFANAPGYSTPGGTRTGTLHGGTNYVYCKREGPVVSEGSAHNKWWLLTDLDEGSPWQNQWVSAFYLSRWGNDEARDNSGAEIRTC